MGSGPHLGGSGAREAPAWETMGHMRNRLTITKTTTALATSALLVLGAVILVQQIEGHILQPLIMGRAVAIHPLVVIIGIASGVVLAGIVGALVAVPLIAVLNTGIRRLARQRPEVPRDAVIVKAATDSGLPSAPTRLG